MLPNGEQSRSGTTDLRFAEVSRRLDGQDKVLEKVSTGIDQLTAASFRIEKFQIQTNEQLTARSEANYKAIELLGKRVEQDYLASVKRDEQLGGMVAQEKADRERNMAERRRAHDEDLEQMNQAVKEQGDKLDKLADKVSDAVIATRIILFITAAFVVTFIGAVVSGHISFVVHP